jgi:hypothetical protein
VNERRRWSLAVAALIAAGCTSPERAPMGRLMLTFERGSASTAMEFLRVSWVGHGAVLADEMRIPQAGALPGPPGPQLGTFEIGVRDPDTWRTVVAHGFVGTRLVAEGAAKVFVPAGQTASVTVRLSSGRLTDADGDGIPDLVDNCPAEPNRGQGQCALADGGWAPDGAGAAPDLGRDAGADAELDVGADPQDGGDGDGPADGPPADGRLGRGKACGSDTDCESGNCAAGRAGSFCASPDMVVVPAGSFSRGCSSRDPSCDRDESPTRVITLKGFEIDRTEITHAALDRCVRAGACTAPAGLDARSRAQHPITNVTWALADAYCRWAGKRLPTEAEWEKAARGPVDVRIYPWGDEGPTCARAQYRDCGLSDAVPVGVLGGISYFGAEDLAGNVAEWVSDFYGSDYYSWSSAVDPRGPTTGTSHVRRGGAFDSDAIHLRVSSRAYGERDQPAQGARCARDL